MYVTPSEKLPISDEINTKIDLTYTADVEYVSGSTNYDNGPFSNYTETLICCFKKIFQDKLLCT